MSRILSLDIETTVRDGYQMSFDDPECWELFAIGVGFRPSADATPETKVLVREGDSPHAERKLLAQLANYARDKAPVDVVMGYNSLAFDKPVLEARADDLAKSDLPHDQTLGFALHDALDGEHRDLFAELKDRTPEGEKWPSLGESLAERGITADEPTLGSHTVVGGDMPAMGRRVLAGDLTHRERVALRRYCESDIRPLFELADALDREHHADAEAREVTR